MHPLRFSLGVTRGNPHTDGKPLCLVNTIDRALYSDGRRTRNIVRYTNSTYSTRVPYHLLQVHVKKKTEAFVRGKHQ